MVLLADRSGYSRAEHVSDAVVHVLGLVLVLIAVPVLITVTAFLRADFTSVFAISVYGAALVAMILFSALYNMAAHPGWVWLLKRLDHAAIYVKIAGTYTPFTMMGGQGGWLLAGIWGAALTGMGLKLVSPHRFRRTGLALYLGLGWAGALAGGTFLAALSGPVVALIVAGGLLYTAGVPFYIFDRLPHHNTIWHVFVLVASIVFYAAVTLHVIEAS